MEFFGKKIRKTGGRIQECTADITSVLQESVASARVIKSFVREDYEVDRFDVENRANFRANMKLSLIHILGLHSGKEVAMKLLPGKENTGIVFVRTDLSGHPEIQALAENVSSTVKATTVSENGTEVFTVEHLMAAFSMMGIDNCRIEMSAPEPPVTDGSAAVFCELILQAGRIRPVSYTHLDVYKRQDGTLLLVVNEGIVEDFKIKGNTKTKDYVIIREMKLKKGEPFNAKDARRSMQQMCIRDRGIIDFLLHTCLYILQIRHLRKQHLIINNANSRFTGSS